MSNKNKLTLCFSLSAFLFYLLTLAVPSGYSYGAALCFLFGLAAIKSPEANRVGVAVALYLVFCGIFFLTWESGFLLGSDFELFLKYLIVAFLSVTLIGKYLSIRIMVYGMCVGTILCFGLSVYQLETIGRAEGFTNAIRYGNISALISLWLFIFGFLSVFSKWERVLILSCSFVAMGSSLASLSRGGWFIYVVAIIIALFLFKKTLGNKKNLLIAALTLTVISLMFAYSNGAGRIQSALKEASDFVSQTDRSASTSVGARLEMYRFAINAILEKPVFGWGDRSIRDELKKRIKRQEYDEYLLAQPHLHNDFLDTTAKRGFLGALGLLFVYVIPIAILMSFKGDAQDGYDSVLLNFAILILPVSYIIFGITDVFFHINISHMFYAFSLLFLFAIRSSYRENFKEIKK